jgi:hypothetical protein
MKGKCSKITGKYSELWHSQHRHGGEAYEELLVKRSAERAKKAEQELVELELMEAFKCCGNASCQR